MPKKGSLRIWGSSPSKHESPSSPRGCLGLGSATPPMQILPAPDEDCIDSPSSGKKSGWYDTINSTIKSMSKKSRKSIKPEHSPYDRHDSGALSEPFNPGQPEFRPSTPIPFQPLPEIQPGIPIKSNKALETIIAGPDGYAPSIDSANEVEQAMLEYTLAKSLAPVEQVKPKSPSPAACLLDSPVCTRFAPCPPTERPPLKNLTSFVMDDVFEDVSQVTVGDDFYNTDRTILENNDIITSLTGLNVDDASTQTENLAHFKSSSTGHIDHITGDWHSNDPAGSAIIGRRGRTVSAELRYHQNIMRQCAGGWLEAQSMLEQIQMAMGDTVARIDPRSTPSTISDIPASTGPCKCRRQRQEVEFNVPCSPWLKISEEEAISIVNSILLNKRCIKRDGVEAFVKAMRNPGGRRDLQTCPNIGSPLETSTPSPDGQSDLQTRPSLGPISRHCTEKEARIALKSFEDKAREKICQSLLSVAALEDWMLRCPPDDTAGVVLEDWLLDCQIGLGDDDDEDTSVKTHPNRRKERADELRMKRKLARQKTSLNKKMCRRTSDKNTVEKRLLRCWLGLCENEPIPTVKKHPNRTRRSWVTRMKAQPVVKETGYRYEKTVSLGSRCKSLGFLALPFRTRPLSSSSEESHPMTLPALSDAATKAASDESHTMTLPALSDTARDEGWEWGVLMDKTPSVEMISPFEKKLLFAAEKLVAPAKNASIEEVDAATIGLLGNWEESSAAKGMLAAETVLLAAMLRGIDALNAMEKGPIVFEGPLTVEEMLWLTLDEASTAAKVLETAHKSLVDAMKKGTAAGSESSTIEQRIRAFLEEANDIIKSLEASVSQQAKDESDAVIIKENGMPVTGGGATAKAQEAEEAEEATVRAYEGRRLATANTAALLEETLPAIQEKAEEESWLCFRKFVAEEDCSVAEDFRLTEEGFEFAEERRVRFRKRPLAEEDCPLAEEEFTLAKKERLVRHVLGRPW